MTESQETPLLDSVLPSWSCVALGKSLPLSGSQLSWMDNKDLKVFSCSMVFWFYKHLK